MGEGVDDAEFEAELETLAPPVYVDPETGMEGTPPDLNIDAPAGPSGVDLPAPDTSGRLDTLGGELDTARTGAETAMGDIEAPGGGNLMDMSMDLFGGDFKPASGMFDMGEMGAPPMDMGSANPAAIDVDFDSSPGIEAQVDQLEAEPDTPEWDKPLPPEDLAPAVDVNPLTGRDEAVREAIRRALKEKLLT
tara:strand:- start:60 stop:635 length:576 start_codon:yes stop_codon:yes gene_type:complete